MTMVLLIDFLRCWLFQCILPSLSRTYHGMTLPYHDYPPPSYQQKLNTFNAQAAASIVVIAIIVDVFRVHRQDEIRTTPPGLQIESQDVLTMDSDVSGSHCILQYSRCHDFICRNISHKAKQRSRKTVPFVFNCFVGNNVTSEVKSASMSAITFAAVTSTWVELTWVDLTWLELHWFNAHFVLKVCQKCRISVTMMQQQCSNITVTRHLDMPYCLCVSDTLKWQSIS